ncbi:MAG: nitroreductase family deazaflavin-dependent oxidoreductase [Anaerolineae bacterium]|nr:nitroreductase family deazaflavin-dependent oxidoreductase [Anaerolineae bacterium]
MEDFEKLRPFFKVMNKGILLMWQMGLGPLINFWPAVIGHIMVITHTGRKSGLKRQNPANYAIVDGVVYCITMPITDWYRNIKANPNIEVWLPDGRWNATAEEIPNDETNLPYLRQVMIASGFAASTFGGVNPRTLSDEELLDKCRDYRLFRIRRHIDDC